MNKKLFPILILGVCVVQQADAWSNWLVRPAKYVRDSVCAVAVGSRDLARDTLYVVNPFEWNTNDRLDFIHGEKWYQLELLPDDRGVATRETLDALEERVKVSPAIIRGIKKMIRKEYEEDSEDREAAQAKVTILEEQLEKDKEEFARLSKCDVDAVGNVFSTKEEWDTADAADESRLIEVMDEKVSPKKAGPQISRGAIPKSEQFKEERYHNGRKIFEIGRKLPYISASATVDHGEQTQEKITDMRFSFLKRLYGIKHTQIYDFHPFVKPYALAWAAAAVWGARKLYTELEVYERFLKPDTGDLEEDELDEELEKKSILAL